MYCKCCIKGFSFKKWLSKGIEFMDLIVIILVWKYSKY